MHANQIVRFAANLIQYLIKTEFLSLLLTVQVKNYTT